MNALRMLTTAAVSVVLIGCATTNDSPARAKTAQLREGMTQGQVRSLFGPPNEVDHDDNYHRGGYIPYYGWRGHGGGEEELKWEYRNPKMEVIFHRGRSGGWVVKEWDVD